MLDRSTIMLCITALSLAACASDGERVADAGSSDTVTPTTSTSAGSVGETLETGSTTMPGGSGSSAADSSSSAASEDTVATEGTQEQMVPEFALLDLNPTSATFEQSVSPRDYLSQASGWYFTHAT